jgi:hypothetical protein
MAISKLQQDSSCCSPLYPPTTLDPGWMGRYNSRGY